MLYLNKGGNLTLKRLNEASHTAPVFLMFPLVSVMFCN